MGHRNRPYGPIQLAKKEDLGSDLLFQCQDIFAVRPLVFHGIHAFLHHVDSETADLALIRGKGDIGIGFCKRIVGDAFIL